jgi:hypothetical protein
VVGKHTVTLVGRSQRYEPAAFRNDQPLLQFTRGFFRAVNKWDDILLSAKFVTQSPRYHQDILRTFVCWIGRLIGMYRKENSSGCVQ